ncbi:hypothetical protein Syun_028862 [Stephania yunnanensis]|uniref:Transcription factor CBF/NF-Y/archaeal histone domain-containing protein n=1 Tax=Stephania yunnanensis TaxID=152371 RepID=A0AAP0EC90_9MAGN
MVHDKASSSSPDDSYEVHNNNNKYIVSSSSPSGVLTIIEDHDHQQQQQQEDGLISSCIKEQDRLLPIANVGRIMKQILPPNAKISKEAKETMQECVSEFISFVTGEASEKCQKEKRKTVNGDDICWALGTLGFDDYAEPLRRYLHKYREIEGEKASSNNNQNNNKGINNSGERGESSIYGAGADHEQPRSRDFRF